MCVSVLKCVDIINLSLNCILERLCMLANNTSLNYSGRLDPKVTLDVRGCFRFVIISDLFQSVTL